MDEKKIPEKTSSIRWKISVAVVAFGMVFNGNIYGFANAAAYSLKKLSRLNDEQISWISSVSNLGVPIGSITCGFLMNTIGRKCTALFFVGGTYFLCHLGLTFASFLTEDYTIFVLICASRLIGGICQGFCNCLNVIYALELCRNQKQRIVVGALISVVGYSATLITYLLGIPLSWKELSYVLALWLIPYWLGILLLVPESPQFYLMKNQKEKAVQTSSKLYGETNCSTLYHEEAQMEPSQNSKLGPWNQSKILKLLIGTATMFFYQFAGYNIVCNNVTEILRTGSNTSPNERREEIAAVIISAAGLVGAFVGLYAIHRKNIKGKYLLVTSAIGTSVSFFILGFLYYYQNHSIDSNFFLYGATAALITHILFFSIGYGALCYTVIAAIQPASVRPLATSVIYTLGGGFAFVSAKSYHDLTFLLGGRLELTFIMYAILNLLGALFMGKMIPLNI